MTDYAPPFSIGDNVVDEHLVTVRDMHGNPMFTTHDAELALEIIEALSPPPEAEPNAAFMQTEEQIRSHWPKALFMPWDEPPIGKRVRRADQKEPLAHGVVQSKFVAKLVPPHNLCLTCRCPRIKDIQGPWWVLKLDTPVKDAKGNVISDTMLILPQEIEWVEP